MVENQGICLTSNWGTLKDVNLISILLNNSSDDTEINLDDITTDNCVCLVRTGNTESSKAHIEIKANGFLRNVILLSEAQIIEVFGVNDEYLLTHNAEFFDDWEEMAVYYSKISIPCIPVCKLKFTRTRNEDRVWVYGAKLQVQNKVNHHVESPVNFNLEQISRLLGSSNLTNINGGKNFKNLLQFYIKNLPNNNLGYLLGKRPPTLSDIHTNISNVGCNESNQESDVTEILSSLQVNVPDSIESQKMCSEPMTSDSIHNNWFTAYVDKKLNEMKTEILHEVDAKINNLREETNHKLDKIISLLET